ncbi:hypothetical protein JEQ12_002381 [Ovis aries]|uniref:Uncharacterized protein n=1 Tax=Ovis aries TaxID=9940 RepID=A0A836D134_SHEEP|nr:hypothetical protein JEQ12_002381 [Ovis aries]
MGPEARSGRVQGCPFGTSEAPQAHEPEEDSGYQFPLTGKKFPRSKQRLAAHPKDMETVRAHGNFRALCSINS